MDDVMVLYITRRFAAPDGDSMDHFLVFSITMKSVVAEMMIAWTNFLYVSSWYCMHVLPCVRKTVGWGWGAWEGNERM